MRPALAALVLAATASSLPFLARAELLLEPMLGAYGGQSGIRSRIDSSADDTVFGFGGGLRLGVEKDNLFSAAEANLGLVDITGGGSNLNFTAGVTAGATLTYIPLRFHVGYDFTDSYSDDRLSLGGSAIRIGTSYYLGESLTLMLQFQRHLFTAVVPQQSSPVLSGITSVSYNSLGLSITLPLWPRSPDTPWRDKYRNVPYTSKTPTEF